MPRPRLAPLKGSTPRLAKGSKAVGQPDPAKEMAVRVVLRPRALARTHRLAVKRRRMLEGDPVRFSEREFAFLQAPDPRALTQLRAYARSTGLEVVEVSRLRHDVVLVGSVDQVQDAFGVELALFDAPGGPRTSHRGAVHLPQHLHRAIVGVLGLDEIPRHVHHAVRARAAVAKAYSPRAIARHYQFPDLTGAGQRIAILSFGGGFHPADIDQYFGQVLRIPPPSVGVVTVGGVRSDPVGRMELAEFVELFNDPAVTVAKLVERFGADGVARIKATLEVTLDIEIAGAAAPGARIDVVFADGGPAGFYEAIYTAIGLGPTRAKPASVVSISWGQSEVSWGGHADPIDEALRAAALKGITVVCSSGDRGSYVDPDTAKPQVKYPAASRYALTVGGTSLTAPPMRRHTREVVWNREVMGMHGASGGGVSRRWRRPAYQRLVPPPDLASSRSRPGRGIPDVAAVADPVGGYRILLGGSVTVGAGTSAGTPLWAGLIACLQEGLRGRAGWLTPLLYRPEFRDAFRDVTWGSNRMAAQDAGFDAREGWDFCTGHGTPLGRELLRCLEALYDSPRARRDR